MYSNLDQTSSYKKLEKLAQHTPDLKQLLTADRIKKYQVKNAVLNFAYATTLVTDEILDNLQKLAAEQKVLEKYGKILAGEIMNVGENRKVLHHMTRTKDRGMYGVQQQNIAQFAAKVHSGKIVGSTGKKFKQVVQIGIGGSDLGPRAMYLALERSVLENKGQLPIKAKFIANVDPDDANLVLSDVDFESTLFIVVSKSGTTQETLTNLKFVQEKAVAKGIKKSDLNKHFIAVTGKGSPMDDPKKYLASFYIDDFIGGRFSSTSAVGTTVLSLAFGAEVVEEFLHGAFLMDEMAKEKDIRKNMTLLAALIGVWERNFLGMSMKAVIPYSEALCRFPAHLQQLDCESNGKTVNIYYQALNYQTGPMIFGEPGTNGQHSFFQKLHQGTDVIPIQFIGFKNAQFKDDLETFGSTSQKKLKANLAAQITALALGKDDKNPNKVFSGNRPSSIVTADQLTPQVLGALLAFYENMVMFQGFIWNINSFDQEGVQLGKVLTQDLLDSKKTPSSALKGIFSLFN